MIYSKKGSLPLTVIAYPLSATIVVSIIYILLTFILPKGGYFSGDQGVKYSQIDTLARTHTLSIGNSSEVLSVFRPHFDSFYREINGHYQAIFSPAYAIVVLPFYLLLGKPGLILPSVFGALLAAHGSGLIGKILNTRYPGAIVLVVGFASPLVFYAFILWEHALSVGLIVMATYLILKSRPLSAGILAALAIWFRPEIMLFGPALALAVLVVFGVHTAINFIMRFSIGCLLGLIPWWIYNLMSFGIILGPQVEANPITFKSRLATIALHLLPLGQGKWALLLVFVSLVLIILLLLRRSPIPALLLLLFGIVGINLVHLGLYLNGGGPSITDVFPFAFVSLISLVLLRKDVRNRLIGVLAGTYLFCVVLITPTWGGGGWGPRMLLGVFPLLAILGWKSFEMIKERLIKLACMTLLASSVIIQAAGLWYLFTLQQQWTQLNLELTKLEPKTVATAVWWLPQVATPILEQMHWYGINDVRDVEKLISTEKCFWWIWTDESTSDWWEKPFHHVSTIPNSSLEQLEVRKLPARGLEATLFCNDTK